MTVGYGDITAQNSAEMIIATFLMIIGVIGFSFATGALSSIIANYDSTEAKTKEKMATLNDIHNEYKLKNDLFNKLVKNIKFDHSKKSKDVLQFMEELPHKLKTELAVAIHAKMYSAVLFFHNKEKSFVAWVSTVIHPLNIQENEYIFKEGEDIIEMYFLASGEAAYVLPRFDNMDYKIIKKGKHFGHLDLLGVRTRAEHLAIQMTSKRRHEFSRKFTVLAKERCELLTISVSDLDKLHIEFPDIYDELFDDAHKRLNKYLKKKKRTIRIQIKQSQPMPTNIFAKIMMKDDNPESSGEDDEDDVEDVNDQYIK